VVTENEDSVVLLPRYLAMNQLSRSLCLFHLKLKPFDREWCL